MLVKTLKVLHFVGVSDATYWCNNEVRRNPNFKVEIGFKVLFLQISHTLYFDLLDVDRLLVLE
jgi:hypothetical protein